MAEFALGLTKTAVEGTLSLVKSTIEEEAQLKEKVQNDLVFISGELEMMQSFLRVANNNNNNNNNDDQVVLTRVRQLRTLAFDVEDCVEYIVHLDLDKSSRWARLRRRAWRKVYCWASPLPLDMAIDEIKELKARVEDVSQRSTRYSPNDSNKYVVMPPPAQQPPDATTYPASAPKFHILRDAWEATGKWRGNMCSLQQELLITPEDDNGLQVISVWGSTGGDLGTASIFKEAFCDPVICEQFKCRAWVKLTHPLNYDEFVKSLLTQFGASAQQSNAGVGFWTKIKDFWTRMKVEVTSQDNIIKVKAKIMQQMRQQRYLVVLEGVFTLEEWVVIRMYLPDNQNGSRIVVSTPQLGIALQSAGEPYQVSELKKFHGDNQFLCAFFKNKMPSGEFYRRLRRDRVISVWGADGDHEKSNLVDILYKGIINGRFKEFEGVLDADKADRVGLLRHGVEFKRHSWVDVYDQPLNLKVFARRLFLNFHSDDIRASKMRKGGKLGEEGLVKWCRLSLFETEDCLVVINGLQSMEDWKRIESTFLLSSNNAAAAKGCCIIVVTDEETVARQCVKDEKYQAFNVKDLEADTSIATLINKGCWHYAISGRKGRLFYDRKKDAKEWTHKFKHYGGINTPDPDEGEDEEEGFRVFTVMGDDETCGKGVLRHAFYGALLFDEQQQTERRRSVSWVDVPRNPFDLMDFSWRLLLDFYSDDREAKEAVAVDLMEGTSTTYAIQRCREFLRNKKCLVVIHGLESTAQWDKIKGIFLSDSEHIQSIIMASSVARKLNTYCSRTKLQPETFADNFNKELRSSSFYTERCQKAWTEIIEPVGRRRELRGLTGLCNQCGLASVWGIPGVGKSTLVRTVYYKQMLRSASLMADSYQLKYCFQAFGWVDVLSPFNLIEFAWRLLLDLYSDDPQAKEIATITSTTEEGEDPILQCRKILQEIRCLVVIDGLCSKQDWDLIKATFLAEPINKKGSIVVITNEEKVAMHCVQSDKKRVVNVRRLEADAALNLVKKIAWEGKELDPQEIAWEGKELDPQEIAWEGKELDPQEIAWEGKELDPREVSEYIVAKCGRLPKVITAIGQACRYRGRSWLQDLSDNFMGTLERDSEFLGLRPLFSWMHSCVNACSDSIKQCVFYLSIFPPEKNIRLRRLLWRWIAEGYCRDTSDGRTSEEIGGEFISELVNWINILQSSSNKRLCQIDGFFHEYISQRMEDNRVFALEGYCSFNSQRGGQHLTIRRCWDRNRIVYESIDFSRLRSLTVFGKWESFFIPNKKLNNKKVNMRLLRVLDLEDAEGVTNEDLEQIVANLTRLKFLSLRGCSDITRLPSSMGGLRQLQTLDLRDTRVVTLPPVITKLQKLRYIRAGTTTEAWDWEGDVLLLPADGQVTNLAAAASSSAQAVTDLPAAAATTIEATPTEGSTNSMAPVVLPPDAGNNRPRALVSSFLSKLCRRGSSGLDDYNGPAAGVTVPADIWKLAVLHTLGVVKVNAQCGNKAIFQELTQLRKLDVSGINKGNIKEFCSAVSGHAHLKSVSMKLDKDYGNLDELDDINQLVMPEKLKLSIRRKVKLYMTIANPEEFPNPLGADKTLLIHHLRIRLIQGGELHIGPCWRKARVVEIQCSSILHIKFDDRYAWEVGVLKVHFSGGSQSSLNISGLSQLTSLKEVWVKGYSDEHRQDMQRQINEIGRRARPVLKFVQTHSSS